MRKVSGPPSGKEYDYTPEVDGDPIVVRLKIPTEADKRRFGKAFKTSIKFDDSGGVVKDADGNTVVDVDTDAADTWRRNMMVGCVVSVSDYADNQSKPILTGADLFEHGESAIVNLVIAEIQTGHTLTIEKKDDSGSSSESLLKEEQASTGIAPSVESGGSTNFAGVNLEPKPSADPSLPELEYLIDVPSPG